MTTLATKIPLSATMSRRSVLGNFAMAPLAAGAAGALVGGAAEAATTPAILGVVSTNDISTFYRFGTYLGHNAAMALFGFNQTSASAFSSSISYVCSQASQLIGAGRQILWSVPFPGGKQLENVSNGVYDSVYKTLFGSILAVQPGSTPIYIRLPWEMNLAGQENAAVDNTGAWNGALYITAYNKIAWIAKAMSGRFKLIWCPNVTTQSYDPLQCWPGRNTVDIIAQDFYMSTKYNAAGSFSWFMNEQRGLAWGVRAAQYYGKSYGLSEWGMDSDTFVGDFNNAANWFKSLGTLAHHHCWWDRPEVIDCRISDGTHPGLATAYKGQFA